MRSQWRGLPVGALLILFVTLVPALEAQDAAAKEAPRLADHAASAGAFLVTLQAVVGPLPAIASSPFFALGGLTALALLARARPLSDTAVGALLRDNAVVREAERYASPELLLALLGLAVVAWLANSGKIQGTIGKLLRIVEDSSAVTAYLFLALGALAGRVHEQSSRVLKAGFIDASASTSIAVAIACGLGLLMLFRFALDVLIWLSPVPFIDFLFETAKWALSAAFAALALFFPRLAAMLSLVLVLIALLLSRWALRLVSFAFAVLIAPVLSRLRGRPLAQPALPIDLPCIALLAEQLPARLRGRLGVGPQGPRFTFRSWHGGKRSRPIGGTGTALELGRALLWVELRVLDSGGRIRERFALAGLDPTGLGQLAREIGARDGGAYGLARLTMPGAATTAPDPVGLR